MNDKKMLSNAGMGVAMENSVSSVKAMADFVTESNDNDGAAKAIERFV